MPIVRENAARPIGASPGPARCSEARKIPLQSKMAPSESSTASAMAPKTASRRLGRVNRGPRSTPSGRSWSRLGTSARETTAPMRATPPRWASDRTPSPATTPASAAPAKAPKEKAACRELNRRFPAARSTASPWAFIEMSRVPLAAPTMVTAANRVRASTANAGRITAPSQIGAAATSGREPRRSDQRSDGRLGDQQAQGCTEQSKSDGAGTEIEPVLDRGQPRIPGTEGCPVEEEDRGDRRTRGHPTHATG